MKHAGVRFHGIIIYHLHLNTFGRSSTLIALHCCDSPQHLMLRPRVQTWNHLNSSADFPFTVNSPPNYRSPVTDEIRASIKSHYSYSNIFSIF